MSSNNIIDAPPIAIDDVRGTPAIDAAVVEFFEGHSRFENHEVGVLIYCEGDKVRVGTPVNGKSDRVTLRFMPDEPVCALAHTHPKMRGTHQHRENKRNEVPSFGDRQAVEHGLPNYVFTPSRAIRVLERINGRFVVRTVLE